MKKIPDAVRLFQVTDSHCYASDDTRLTWTDMPIYPNLSLKAMLAHLGMCADGYSALMLTGDLAQEEIPETYQRVNAMLNTIPVAGLHHSGQSRYSPDDAGKPQWQCADAGAGGAG